MFSPGLSDKEIPIVMRSYDGPPYSWEVIVGRLGVYQSRVACAGGNDSLRPSTGVTTSCIGYITRAAPTVELDALPETHNEKGIET